MDGSKKDPMATGKREAAELARDARQRATGELESRKDGAAAQVDEIADAVDRAAAELGGERRLSQYAGELAGTMHGIAGRLRDRNVDEIAADVQQLARRNPTLFVLGSIGVGLALSRFLKASPRREHDSTDAARAASGPARASSVDAAGTASPGVAPLGAPPTFAGSAPHAGAVSAATGTGAGTPDGGVQGVLGSKPGPMGRADTLRGTQH